MEKIKECLIELINQPFSDIINFNLAVAYEEEKQYAAAFSYYLRCAEFTEDNVLSSESLIRCALCINRQGGRDQKELYFIKHAITASPNSLEPYLIASLYFSWRSSNIPEKRYWLDSYMYANIAINILENNNQSKEKFKIELGFKIYELYYQKAYAGINIGKINEAREIFIKILLNFHLSDSTKKFILNKLNELPESNISIKKFKNYFNSAVFEIDHKLTTINNYHNNTPAIFKLYKKCYICDCIRRGYRWEEHQHDVIDKYLDKNSIAIEAGSHIGTLAIKLAKTCKLTYCFEPVINTYDLLEFNMKVNCNSSNYKLFNKALGECIKNENICWISPDSACAIGLDNNIYEPLNNNEKNNAIEAGSKDISIEITTIDSLQLDKLDYIKIDVEGYEQEVINGGINTIKKCKPIIILECYETFSPLKEATIKFVKNKYNLLLNLGYEVEHIWKDDFLFIPKKNIIPNNIFLTWETKIDTISPEMLNFINSWKKHNNNYKINFYDSSDRYNFIKDNFDFDVQDAYNRLKPGAFKCDLWRYCILYIYGGFYADIDTKCLSSLDTLKQENIDFICPIDLNPNIGCQYNLSNGFIGSIPKHPILKMCIDHIVQVINKYSPNNNIIISNISGPGCLGININKYLNREWNTSFVGEEGNINNIKFLKFNKDNQYIYDISKNINILQNKNGNPELQKAYKNECSKLNNFICYGKFGEFTKIGNIVTYYSFDYICNDINNNNPNLCWGWCSAKKAIKIQKFIQDICSTFDNPICVEIGVFGGMSCIPVLIELYKANKGVLHAIDPWDNIEAIKGYYNEHYNWWLNVDLNYFYNFFKYNISKYNFDKFVNIIKLPSDNAPSISNINYLYIDGQHTEQAFRDINNFAINITKNGILILDDINWNEITKKLPEYIIQLGFEKIDEVDDAFIFKRINTLSNNITLNINKENINEENINVVNYKNQDINKEDIFRRAENITSINNYHDNSPAKFYLYENDLGPSACLKRGFRWEEHQHDIIDQYLNKETTAIEIGSHIGSITIKLAKVCSKVYAFEPIVESYNILKDNLQLNNCNNVILHNLGCGEKNKKVAVKWLCKNNPGGTGLEGGILTRPSNIDDEIIVEIITLDSIKFNKVDYIKIDVEGYEELVIKGAEETIKTHKPLIIMECFNKDEFNNNNLNAKKASYSEICERFKFLIDLGYTFKHIAFEDFLFLPQKIIDIVEITKPISNINPNLIVIDDFYTNPDEIRKYALSLNYQPPKNHGAVGFRCQEGRKILDGTKQLFEKLLHKSIPNGNNIGEWNYSTNGCFQWCNASVPIVYHADSQNYAGIIYLTPDAPPQCGTSFLRHKKYKIRNNKIFSKSDWYESDLNYKEPHLDKTQWEIVDSIGNVYNRLVIFDAHYIHAVTEYFGEDINNSRLFQLFFFNIE
jgi:FkbM family methyltransferase